MIKFGWRFSDSNMAVLIFGMCITFLTRLGSIALCKTIKIIRTNLWINVSNYSYIDIWRCSCYPQANAP